MVTTETEWPVTPVAPKVRRSFRGRDLIIVGLTSAVVGAATALVGVHQPPRLEAPKPAAVSKVTTLPWCQVDREMPEYLTVRGPAGGRITVDGRDAGFLELTSEDVADDSGPYSGILFNVEGPGAVAVNGIDCVTVSR